MPSQLDELAIKIAVLLDRNPEIASKVKQYLTEARLLELLDLPKR